MLLLALAVPASAHPVPYSYLDIRLTSGGLETTLVIHDFDLAHDLGIREPERLLNSAFLSEHAASIHSLLAERLLISADGAALQAQWDVPQVLREAQSVLMTLRYPSIHVMPKRIAVRAAMFPYDPIHQTFVNIYENGEVTHQAILDLTKKQAEYTTGSGQTAISVIRRFIPEGIHHILIGPDHILFLVGLLLMGGSARRLLVIVTAFTFAHSITLTLAALGIFSPSPQIIEPAIALSIVYVGFDNLLVRKGRDVRAWIAFAFGFIHGFGFANVLREMELPRRALGWSLFSFNAGVEIGQLLIVLIVASLLAAIRARSEKAGRYIAVAGSIVVIAAGAFWFAERVFSPGRF